MTWKYLFNKILLGMTFLSRIISSAGIILLPSAKLFHSKVSLRLLLGEFSANSFVRTALFQCYWAYYVPVWLVANGVVQCKLILPGHFLLAISRSQCKLFLSNQYFWLLLDFELVMSISPLFSLFTLSSGLLSFNRP